MALEPAEFNRILKLIHSGELEAHARAALDEQLPVFPDQDEKDRAQFLDFIAALNVETARGCVLVAAANIEHGLGELLQTYMRDGSDVTKSLLNPKKGGPLGTHHARASLGYALGALDEDEYADLLKIAEIRNHIAHRHDVKGFHDQKATTLCGEFRTEQRLIDAGQPKGPTPRIRFTNVAGCLCGLVNGRTSKLLADGSRGSASPPSP